MTKDILTPEERKNVEAARNHWHWSQYDKDVVDDLFKILDRIAPKPTVVEVTNVWKTIYGILATRPYSNFSFAEEGRLDKDNFHLTYLGRHVLMSDGTHSWEPAKKEENQP